MAVRRRVIWMPDDEWALLKAWATSEGMTASALIRERVALPSENAIPAMPQAKRDAILRRINK